MALQPINLGLNPNDNQGDKLRAGGTKINANFVEIDSTTAKKAANLSDLTDKAAARDNLGVELGADVQPAQEAVYGNLLDNPDGQFNQRLPASNADATFGHDRWKAYTESGAIAVSTIADAENGTPFLFRLTQSQAAAQRMAYGQALTASRSKLMRGKTLALSGRLRSSVALTVRYAVLGWTGAADAVAVDLVNNWGSATYSAGNFFVASLDVIASGSIALAANTLTDLPAAVGAAGGAINNLIVIVWTDAAAAQNVTLDFRAQLEVGLIATRFKKRFDADALMSLLQHFRKTFPAATAPAQNAGSTECIEFGQVAGAGINQVCPWVQFGVLMIKVPTVTIYNPSAANAQVRNPTVALDWSATAVSGAARHGFTMTATAPAGSTPGQYARFHYTAEAEIF